MLTQQLYNTKVRLRNELQAKTTAAASSHAAASDVCVCPHCHVHRKKPAVTGDRYYALGSNGVVPVGRGRGVDYQTSPAIAPGTGSGSRSRVSRIQRRHFRNSSSPASQDVRNLSQSESKDGYSVSPSKTGTKGLPTPPLTPRPPPTSAASPAPPMIRRASNPMRKQQSPSPRSSRDQIGSSGSTTSMTTSCTSVATLTDGNAHSETDTSLSTTSVGNIEGKVLDPVLPHRQGVVPQELRELLQSRENGGDLGEQLQQLLISKPPPLPPIVSDDDNDQTTPTQSGVFHHLDPTAAMTIDRPNNLTTVHPSDPVSSSRVKGHHQHHHHPHAYHPAGIRQHHRHFILAKAQGLSSAPSTVRLLRYSPPAQQGQDLIMREVQEVGGSGGSGLLVQESEEGIVDEVKERGTVEGTLLVKETIDRKDSALQELHQR